MSLPLDLPEPLLPGLEIIKLVSMLNSAEHEIYPANINVKMPTIVGILTFISMINTTH